MRYFVHLVHVVHSVDHLTTQVALSLHRELSLNASAIVVVGFHKQLKETSISDPGHQNIVVASSPKDSRKLPTDGAWCRRRLIRFGELDCLDNILGFRDQRVTSGLLLEIS